MTAIRLSGGRGSVVGQLVHINPNYVVIMVDGVERFVPQWIIATMKRI
jgi:ribosomal protein L16/L10AE